MDKASVKEKVKAAGLITGGTGNKVDPIAACKGTVCTYGLMDTQALCSKLHNKYFSKDLPGKFKIGIVGCPNNCVKAPLNDLGLMAQRSPKVLEENCKGCKLCMKACKVNAIEIVDKIAKVDYDKCINCWQCISKCPFKAMEVEKEGVAVFLGGKFGRRYRVGDRLSKLYTATEAETLTEKVIEFYNKNAINGERFADTIERLGVKYVQNSILELDK